MTATYIHPAEITVRPRYDIEGDWILFSTCNFRCTYCFWDEKALGAKIAPIASVERLSSFFDDTGLTWLLHLTGGEPFVYPEFTRLSQLLTARHSISINTNGDSHHIPSFVGTVDPRQVDFINCGVHEGQRAIRRGTERFTRNFRTLADAGFDVFASCVMYPDLFPTFRETWDRYAGDGVVLIPKALRGTHLGRSYPSGYTAEEREMFIEYTDMAAESYAEQFARRTEPPTINPFMDRHLFLHELADYRGDLCDAGYRFVRIAIDGEVRRCGPEDVIGHVAEGWFNRRLAPSRCTDTECPYFCEKYRVR